MKKEVLFIVIAGWAILLGMSTIPDASIFAQESEIKGGGQAVGGAGVSSGGPDCPKALPELQKTLQEATFQDPKIKQELQRINYALQLYNQYAPQVESSLDVIDNLNSQIPSQECNRDGYCWDNSGIKQQLSNATQSARQEMKSFKQQVEKQQGQLTQQKEQTKKHQSQMEQKMRDEQVRQKQKQMWQRCTSKKFPPAAYDLITALNNASARPIYNLGDVNNIEEVPLPKGKPTERERAEKNCQAFFRALGEELANRGLPSWNKDWPLSDYGKTQADRIVADIDKIAAKQDGNWKHVDSWEEAQVKANEGYTVIGGVRGDPGHLEFVVPIPPGTDLSQFKDAGSGPFVRDGNEHWFPKSEEDRKEYKDGWNDFCDTNPQKCRLEPSTYGAVPASRAANLKDTKWYIWDPSVNDPNFSVESGGTVKIEGDISPSK